MGAYYTVGMLILVLIAGAIGAAIGRAFKSSFGRTMIGVLLVGIAMYTGPMGQNTAPPFAAIGLGSLGVGIIFFGRRR